MLLKNVDSKRFHYVYYCYIIITIYVLSYLFIGLFVYLLFVLYFWLLLINLNIYL